MTPRKYPKGNKYNIKHPQVAMDPNRFNALLAENGIRIGHEKVSLCPNFIGDSDSNYHALDCKLCDNSFVHFDYTEFWVLFSQNALVENFFSQGYWDRGTALMTAPSITEDEPPKDILIGYFDKITLLDFTERTYELIHKSDGDVDKLKYKAVEILFLRTKDKIYKPYKDFEVNKDGNILWVNPENRPLYDVDQEVGELFTVSYTRRPQYRVVELLHEGRYNQFHFKEPYKKTVRFPQQALIKKDFLINKEEIEKNVIPSLVQGGVIQPPNQG